MSNIIKRNVVVSDLKPIGARLYVGEIYLVIFSRIKLDNNLKFVLFQIPWDSFKGLNSFPEDHILDIIHPDNVNPYYPSSKDWAIPLLKLSEKEKINMESNFMFGMGYDENKPIRDYLNIEISLESHLKKI